MATTPVTRARASASTKAAAPDAAEAQTKGVSRREFLYYIWGASLSLLLAETTGAIIWFALPRFRAGEYGGVFTLDPKSLPKVGTGTEYKDLSAPIGFPSGKFWISNQSQGLYALSMICTHLGCLFKWVDTTHRFECPCHGSKFTAAGVKLTSEEIKDGALPGPAQRNLDRFAITVTTPSGSAKTDAAGHAVKVDGATSIAVDTGKKIQGIALGAPGQKQQ